MNTLGLACIATAFQDAAMYYTHTNGYFGTKKMSVASQALAFIQGTSLEICIKSYGLELEAENLRTSFFRIFHVKKSA